MTPGPHKAPRVVREFRRNEAGAALVEFAFLLPTLMIIFALAIEGGRTFWSYQSVIAGVRDASRYVGRATPSNICSEGGTISGLNPKVTSIVSQSVDGQSLFPSSITITNVAATHNCVVGDYRISPAPVATVTAILEISYPFADVFGFIGVNLSTVTTSVYDSTRIFGA